MYTGIAIGLVVGYTIAFFIYRKRGSRAWSKEEAREFSNEGHKVVQDRILRRKEKIMAFAVREGRVANDDVEDMFCIGDSTAGNYLRELAEVGKLERVGSTGRGVYYKIKNDENK